MQVYRDNVFYGSNVFYSKDDGGYIADIPGLKFCSAFGETPGDALQEVLRAKDAWFAAVLASHLPIPRYRPALYQTV